MIINNVRIILPDGIMHGAVETEGEKILRISRRTHSTSDGIDAKGLYLCPGFVDIHAHGGGGVDFMDDSSYRPALEFHAKNGTTSIVPTAITAPAGLLLSFLERIRDEIKKQSTKEPTGSRILGAHLEGPYLSVKNKGAHPQRHLLVPARDSYDFILNNADVIKTVTVAPELEGAAEMVAALRRSGITVCGGHDDGRRSTLSPALSAGITHLTHLWCAMSRVEMYDGVREAGLLEIGLSDRSLTAEIIADGHHMTPELVKIVYNCKGADRACVVSDCLRAGGMPPDGRLWTLGRECDRLTEFIVSNGVARLPDNTRLAGSIQPISQMVKGLVSDCGIPLCDAVKMGSLTPARIVGEDRHIGSIEEGKRADLCLLDEDLNVKAVFIGGRRIV